MTKATLLLLIPALILGACMNREYVVESDYSYGGTFKKYKTFAFMQEAGVVKDSTELKEYVQRSIKRRMELQGYRFNDKRADILVSYKIFRDDFKFEGYNQPDLVQWLIREDPEEEYDPIKYNMYKGTLLVIFWDRKKDKVVWQGYASTMFGSPYTNDKYIKWAVRSIFDQYRVFASEYAMIEERE